ncbi:MAG: glycosyltransferase family 4 protein [candidate division Zixibacteria bacterium]|nr:glycosyltransferase family 4 protein [candidate division Zixibacteria bacterium]
MTNKRIVIFGWANSVHIHRWAAGLRERGCEVKVISLDGWEVDGCETVVFPRSGRWSYLAHASTAVREAQAFKPDLIHLHYVSGFGLWGVWSRFSPLVMSVWGSDVVDFPSTRLRRAWLRYQLGKATHITATSDFLRKTTRNLLPAVEQRISVIPFGVNVPNTTEPLPSMDYLRLCFIKNHKSIYGLDILLRALARAKSRIPNIKLSLAGRGEMTGELQSMVTDLNIADIVDLVGFIENKNIYKFISQHHMVVMPSRREAFGVAALEAGICGRPVIASNVGGVPEVLRDGETGILIPPNDPEALAEAIMTLSQNADLMKKMGDAGHLFVRDNFSWDRSLDMMIELYERLISEASHA